MTATSVALLLADLGVAKTQSRPYLSDDNPYSEAHFKTIEYCVEFPERFGSQEEACGFFRAFFRWYNGHHHHHTARALLRRGVVQYGMAEEVLRRRQQVLDAA